MVKRASAWSVTLWYKISGPKNNMFNQIAFYVINLIAMLTKATRLVPVALQEAW